MRFCELYNLPPLPVSERVACLFVAFLVHQGLKPQSIDVYLSAVRHLQVVAGLPPMLRNQWPRLQYLLRGVKRSQDSAPNRVRLPITAPIMQQLQAAWARAPPAQQFEATMLWAAACMGYFGFMRAGEFTTSSSNDPPAILASDVAVDSHTNPSMLRILLQRDKTDPFGKGVVICVGRTNAAMCPVAALLGYLAVRPAGEGPLFIFRVALPLKGTGL